MKYGFIYSEKAKDNIYVTKEKPRQELLRSRSARRTNFTDNSSSLVKLYMLYPYKKYFKPGTKESNQFTIKKSNGSIHKYSLSYNEYKLIIAAYSKHLYNYLLSGKIYVFTSGIGEIQIKRYKPKFLGWNIGKAIKKLAKDKGLTYAEAKMQIPNNKEYLEERKNILLGGYKFKLFWFNRYNRVMNLTYWNLEWVRRNYDKKNDPFTKTLKYYQQNKNIFDQLVIHKRNPKNE